MPLFRFPTSAIRPVAVLAAAITLALLAACAGNERPKPTPLTPVLPRLAVQLSWTSHLGLVDFPLAVKVVGGTAYVADSAGTVAAIDGASGADVWRAQINGGITAGVGSDGRYTAVVSAANDLVVLDKGSVLWRQHLTAMTLTAPLVAGARVFTLAADRTITAFDAGNGRQLWQQTRSSDALVLGQSTLLTAVGDTLVVGQGGRVQGLNPGTGLTLWEVAVATSRGTNEVERLADVVSVFYRDGDQICVRAFQYTVSCLNARSGKLLWSKAAVGGVGVAGDATGIFATEADGRLIAYEKSDGTKRWQYDGLKFHTLSAPLVVGKAMVFGDENGNLHFFSTSDAEPINRLRTDDSAVVTTPVMAGKRLLAVTRNGGVFAFRSE